MTEVQLDGVTYAVDPESGRVYRRRPSGRLVRASRSVARKVRRAAAKPAKRKDGG